MSQTNCPSDSGMKPRGLPHQKLLRDGSTATIRVQQTTDAKALLDFYRALPEQDRIFLDDDVTSADWIDRFIHRSDFQKVYPIVAEAGGAIQGHAWLIRAHHGWLSHVGQLRLAVARDYQRRGLGSALVKDILCLAVDLGLEMMTARVMENQAGALKMFERLGFIREATLKGMVKDVNGRRRNMIILGNDISQIWRAMELLVADIPPTREMLQG